MHDLRITAVLRYRDPAQSAQWLCDAFGFRIDSVKENPPGSIDYICLGYGESVLLVGSTVGDVQGGRRSGGDAQESQSCYLTVTDIKGHYERAVAHGADVTLNAEAPDAGSDFYVCRDPEGHLWSFGTFDFTSTGRGGAVHGAEPADPPSAAAEPVAVAAKVRRGASFGLLAYTALVASGITAGALLLPISRDDSVVTLLVGGTTQNSAPADIGESAALELLRSEIAGLQRERVGLIFEVERSEGERNTAAAALDQSEQRLSEATGALERARSAEASARTAAEAAEAKLVALSEELEDTSASLRWEREGKKKIEAALQSALADRDAVRAEAGRLAKAVDTLETANKQALDRAAASVADQASAAQDLQSKLDALSGELAQRTTGLEAEREARAKSETALEGAQSARDAARTDLERRTTELDALRRSHVTALETIKIKEEERVAALNKLDTTVAETTRQLAAARAETEALQPAVDGLRARVKELEKANRDSAGKAALVALEKRHKQDLAAKNKLIESLSAQIKEARKPAKAKATAKATAKPKRTNAQASAKANGKVAAAGPDAAAAQPDADDFVLEDDAEAMQPERVRRCSRVYFDHC